MKNQPNIKETSLSGYKFQQTWGDEFDKKSLDPTNFRIETMSGSLHRTGSKGLLPDGSPGPADESAQFNRWGMRYDKHHDELLRFTGSSIRLHGKVTDEPNPMRIDFTRDGVVNPASQHTLYGIWIDGWHPKRTPQGTITDPDCPNRLFKKNTLLEAEVSFENIRIPAHRFSWWLLAKDKNYDYDASNGVEIDFEYCKGYPNALLCKVVGGGVGDTENGIVDFSSDEWKHLGIDLTKGKHTLAFLWEDGRLGWLVDGHLVNEDLVRVPDVEMYTILSREGNLGVKAKWDLRDGDVLEQPPHLPADPSLYGHSIYQSMMKDDGSIDYELFNERDYAEVFSVRAYNIQQNDPSTDDEEPDMSIADGWAEKELLGFMKSPGDEPKEVKAALIHLIEWMENPSAVSTVSKESVGAALKLVDGFCQPTAADRDDGIQQAFDKLAKRFSDYDGGNTPKPNPDPIPIPKPDPEPDPKPVPKPEPEELERPAFVSIKGDVMTWSNPNAPKMRRYDGRLNGEDQGPSVRFPETQIKLKRKVKPGDLLKLYWHDTEWDHGTNPDNTNEHDSIVYTVPGIPEPEPEPDPEPQPKPTNATGGHSTKGTAYAAYGLTNMTLTAPGNPNFSEGKHCEKLAFPFIAKGTYLESAQFYNIGPHEEYLTSKGKDPGRQGYGKGDGGTRKVQLWSMKNGKPDKFITETPDIIALPRRHCNDRASADRWNSSDIAQAEANANAKYPDAVFRQHGETGTALSVFPEYNLKKRGATVPGQWYCWVAFNTSEDPVNVYSGMNCVASGDSGDYSENNYYLNDPHFKKGEWEVLKYKNGQWSRAHGITGIFAAHGDVSVGQSVIAVSTATGQDDRAPNIGGNKKVRTRWSCSEDTVINTLAVSAGLNYGNAPITLKVIQNDKVLYEGTVGVFPQLKQPSTSALYVNKTCEWRDITGLSIPVSKGIVYLEASCPDGTDYEVQFMYDGAKVYMKKGAREGSLGSPTTYAQVNDGNGYKDYKLEDVCVVCRATPKKKDSKKPVIETSGKKPVFSVEIPKKTISSLNSPIIDQMTNGKTWWEKNPQSLSIVEHQNEHWMKADHVPSDEGSPRIIIQTHLPKAQEYWLEQEIFLERDWDYGGGKDRQTAKLGFGLAGGRDEENRLVSGGSKNPNGFTSRPTTRGNRATAYVYCKNRNQRWGDDYVGPVLSPGVVHKIGMGVIMNDHGRANGQLIMTLDGEQWLHEKTMEWMDNPLINALMGCFFFGGNGPEWSPERMVSSYHRAIQLFENQP